MDIIKKLKDMESDTHIVDIFPKNGFDHLINRLENDYISKSDGIERIKCALDNWDLKARKNIIIALIRRLEETGAINTVSNVIELAELI